LMGRRLDMAPRAHRQALVVLIYAGLAGLMIGLWFADRWRSSGYWMILASLVASRLFLGGYTIGGLIKPFSGKGPRPSPRPPSMLALGLRLYHPRPQDRVYENDERELRQRDRVHFWAYQALASALVVMWMLASVKANTPRLLGFLSVSADKLLYGLVLVTVVASLTLPQAILLWTEPDMEPDL
jgi:hypothetical protein